MSGLKSDSDTLIGLFANFQYEFYFKVDNMHDLLSEEKVVHPEIITSVLSLAYSTLRGIILERTCGTLLGSVILPIVNPLQLLKYGVKPDNKLDIKRKKWYIPSNKW